MDSSGSNVENNSNRGSTELYLLRAVVNNANDAILVTEAWPVVEPGSRIVYVNEAFSRMTAAVTCSVSRASAAW